VGYLFDDIKYNAAYYAEHGIEFRAAVVISGQAYKFFVEDDPELPAIQAKFRPILEELVEDYGVEFNMCVVGMERQGLSTELLYPFVEAEKSQPIYLTDYQADGYGYLPLH
jgi:intracellular sulfur oxidation DsrE/DsrF family protein